LRREDGEGGRDGGRGQPTLRRRRRRRSIKRRRRRRRIKVRRWKVREACLVSKKGLG